MAKNKENGGATPQRQNRREILKQRKLREQNRQVRIGVFIVGGLLLAIILIAVVSELIIQPSRPVAIVQGEEISLREWQERVRYERAQLIILLEDQLEAFGGDVGIIQQFAGQAIVQLVDEEAFGQTVLDTMVDEVLIRHAAEARGIAVSEAEVEARIGEIYSYFGGELPTPLPTATETIMPTPSLTPIPTAVITEVIPTSTPFPTPTLGPTNTPFPTATPVSQASFDEQYSEFIDRLNGFGIDEEMFRRVTEMQIYREKLQDALAEEEELPTEGPHASYFRLTFNSEEEANEAVAMIEEEGFLTVWNTISSLPPDPESGSTARANETLWRSRETVEAQAGDEIAEAVFSLDLNTPSELIAEEIDEETTTYSIVMVTGREVRDFTESQINQAKGAQLTSFLSTMGDVERTTVSFNRAPRTPVLDPLFLAPPTATPEIAAPGG